METIITSVLISPFMIPFTTLFLPAGILWDLQYLERTKTSKQENTPEWRYNAEKSIVEAEESVRMLYPSGSR